MKNLKPKIVLATLVVGFGLMAYGLQLHVQPVFSELSDRGQAMAEPMLMKEVSIGGLQRDEIGRLHLTYTGVPPEACPT